MRSNSTTLAITFLFIVGLGAGLFYFFMDAWPASLQTWLVVTVLGVLIWSGLGVLERLFLKVTDAFLPQVRYVSRFIDKELAGSPLSGVIFTSQLLFTMIRVLVVVALVALLVNWLSETVRLPEGYQIRYFVKKEWRLELR